MVEFTEKEIVIMTSQLSWVDGCIAATAEINSELIMPLLQAHKCLDEVINLLNKETMK